MTEVTIYEADDGLPIGFSAQNHAEHGSRGSDIVCAGISTVFEMLYEGIKEYGLDSFEIVRNPDEITWTIRVRGSAVSGDFRKSLSPLFHGASRVLHNISETYPDHCTITRNTV